VADEPEPELDDYGRMIAARRGFLSGVAGARPPRETVRDIESTLTRWSKELDQYQVPERERPFGRRGEMRDGSVLLTDTRGCSSRSGRVSRRPLRARTS
jgi:hypothetical protein